MSNSQSKSWCFTINNPSEFDLLDEETLREHNDFQYMVIGHEYGSTGTFHHQGFVQLKQSMRFNEIKRILSRAHLEPRRGPIDKAIDYCKKDGVFYEYGEPILSAAHGNKQMWRRIIHLAESNQLDVIKEEYPAMFLRYYEKLRSLVKVPRVILDVLENEWWVGETGTGKSRKLWADYPDHYAKELNKWWCGYRGEDIVAIEEWSPKNECTASQLKIWADRYPFTAQIKGGSMMNIRPKKIIVLSNYTIDQCFGNNEDLLPIKRRFKTIRFSRLELNDMFLTNNE